MDNKLDKVTKSLQSILTEAVERGRDKAVELVKKRVKSGKDHNEQPFSDYGRSQRSRRKKEGLQTGYKDFHYTGTMFENFSEISRTVSQTNTTIVVSFIGDSKRRADQKAASNAQVAQWITDQEGKSVVGVSDKEKREIEEAIKKGVIEEIGKITIT